MLVQKHKICYMDVCEHENYRFLYENLHENLPVNMGNINPVLTNHLY